MGFLESLRMRLTCYPAHSVDDESSWFFQLPVSVHALPDTGQVSVRVIPGSDAVETTGAVEKHTAPNCKKQFHWLRSYSGQSG